MPRIPVPPGCAGFADGNEKYMAVNGPGSYVNIDDTDPAGKRALKKLRNQDYAAAGLVDAGPEKFYVKKGPPGRFCLSCNTLWHSWTRTCPKCETATIPEQEMNRALPEKYTP
jgi:hypothetical protein